MRTGPFPSVLPTTDGSDFPYRAQVYRVPEISGQQHSYIAVLHGRDVVIAPSPGRLC